MPERCIHEVPLDMECWQCVNAHRHQGGGTVRPDAVVRRRRVVDVSQEKPDLEGELLDALHAAGVPEPERQYRFHGERAWRLDFAWPAARLGVEVDGGIYTGGRHVRGRGYEEDALKHGEAAVLGWRVLRITARMIRDGTALDLVERALADEGGA